MGINLVIVVTDGDWFEMLRQQPNLDEVNFWAPSARNFRALQPGEMFGDYKEWLTGPENPA